MKGSGFILRGSLKNLKGKGGIFSKSKSSKINLEPKGEPKGEPAVKPAVKPAVRPARTTEELLHQMNVYRNFIPPEGASSSEKISGAEDDFKGTYALARIDQQRIGSELMEKMKKKMLKKVKGKGKPKTKRKRK